MLKVWMQDLEFKWKMVIYFTRRSHWDEDLFNKRDRAKKSAVLKSQHDKVQHLKQGNKT